ncbi:hypothetical protein EDB85DRAFT_1894537 [Lactarius pseudohatsudake]|nr:hypothetical protein EDB85DRAFT_1894537 [Lactarius pseudohatsudake]
MVAPSLHGRRRSLRAADSRRGRVAVAPWPCRGCAVVVSCVPCHHCAVVAPSSRVIPSSRQFAQSVVVVRVVVVRLAPHRVRRRVGSGGGGLRSESTCGSGVGGGRRWGRWRSRPKSPSPPPPPPCSTQARRRCLQPIATHKSAATTTPYSAQEPPQRHLCTVRKNRRSATSARRATPTATTPTPTTTVTRRREQHRGRNDGDAAAGTARRQERR